MAYPAIARRVGAMLDLLDYNPGNELRGTLDSFRAAIDRNSPFARISLLPGICYSNLNETWLVNMP